MHVLEGNDGSFSPDDFSMKITHVVEVLDSETYSETFEAVGTIRPDYLRLICENSGQCSWALKGEVKPVLIEPMQV